MFVGELKKSSYQLKGETKSLSVIVISAGAKWFLCLCREQIFILNKSDKMINKKNVLIWCRDDIIADAEVQKELLKFGGIKTTLKNSLELAKKFPIENILYDIGQNDKDAKMLYLGECGTRRIQYPDTSKFFDKVYGDESSPYRLKYLAPYAKYLGYSSYRFTLFTIPTRESDINIRMIVFSPVLTLRFLHWKYKEKNSFVWIDLKKNIYFCYPYRTYLDPSQTGKSWSFKPFMKIPFDWHVRRMLKFAEKYNKKVFIYGGDYDANSKEEFLERISIISKYLS